MKKFILVTIIIITAFNLYSKDELEPKYIQGEQKLFIGNISFSNIIEYSQHENSVVMDDVFKDNIPTPINPYKGFIFNQYTKHYISKINKNNFIVYKKEWINLPIKMAEDKNELKYYDECKESNTDEYRLLSCKGKYLDENININKISKNTTDAKESLFLSENFFTIMKNNLFKGKEFNEEVKKRKENKFINIYTGIAKTTTIDEKCPTKIYLKVFKDFSYNTNPYGFYFDNGNIETFGFTEFNVNKKEKGLIKGKYRTYISETLQCRGEFKIKLFGKDNLGLEKEKSNKVTFSQNDLKKEIKKCKDKNRRWKFNSSDQVVCTSSYKY